MTAPSTQIITTIEDIIAQESKPFLELAVVNALWEEWGLSNAFVHSTSNTDLPTALIAKILTINKCLSPCSHYSLPHWVHKTALSEILGQSLEPLNDDKIYYELDKIACHHQTLEDHLFRMTYKKDHASYRFVNYDLSSSYFVGCRCQLSAYGKSKDDKPHSKQVVLGILVNDRGYPFKWDVYPGNTAEVTTLVKQVDACRSRFKLHNITLVFDRGLVSDENLDYIATKHLKYISALDKNQIASIEGIDLTVFRDLTLNTFKERLTQQHFTRYDESLYFIDLGQIKHRRYLLGFNPIRFKDDKEHRREKLAVFEQFLRETNTELQQAKRSRSHDATKQRILKQLKRLKIQKYFHTPVLQDVEIQRTNKNGERRLIRTFHVSIEKKTENIAQSELLDGLCVFVSNHTEIENHVFCFPPENMIKAYRDKTKIEDAFKHIKSFLKIRPFHVNTDDHVRAAYSICVLSYFLNKDLAERRKQLDGVDYLNSKNLYEPFRSCHYVTVKDNASQRTKSAPIELTGQQQQLLQELHIQVTMPQKIV
jgi:transposase